MSRSSTSPPFTSPSELFATDEADAEYLFVEFSGDAYPSGHVQQDLLRAIRKMPETLLVLRGSWKNDVYALFRIPGDLASYREFHRWLDENVHQRIVQSVRQGWVRNGDNWVMFKK